MACSMESKFITHHWFIAISAILFLSALSCSWFAHSFIILPINNGAPRFSFSSSRNNYCDKSLLQQKIHDQYEDDSLSFRSKKIFIDNDTKSMTENNTDESDSLASFLHLTGANDETRRMGIASFLQSRVEQHQARHPQHEFVKKTDSDFDTVKADDDTETIVAAELNSVKVENSKLLRELKAESLARVKAESTIKQKEKDLEKTEENLRLLGTQIENERLARRQAEKIAFQAIEDKDKAEKFIQASGAALRTVEEKAKIEAGARFIAEKEMVEEKEKYGKLLDQMELKAREVEHMEAMMRQNKQKLEEATLQLDSAKKQLKAKQDSLKRLKQKGLNAEKKRISTERMMKENDKAVQKAKFTAKTEIKRIRKKLGRERMARLEAEEEARVAIEAKEAAHALIDIEVDARRTAEKKVMEEIRLRADMDAIIQAKDANYNKLLGRLEGKQEDWIDLEVKLNKAQEELKNATAKVIAAQIQLDQEIAARQKTEKEILSANEAKASLNQLIKEKEDIICKERRHAESETKKYEQQLEKVCDARKKAEKEARIARDEKAAAERLFGRKVSGFEKAKYDFEAKLKLAKEEFESISDQVTVANNKLQEENAARLKAEEEVVTANKAKISLERLIAEKDRLLEKNKSSAKSDKSLLEQLLQRECAARKKSEDEARIANDAKIKVNMLLEKEGAALVEARQKAEEEAVARVAAEEESREEKIKSYTLLEELKVEREAKRNIEDRARKAREELQNIEDKVAITKTRLKEETAARLRAEKNAAKIKEAKIAIENSMKPMEEAMHKALASAEEAEGALHEYLASMNKAEIKANGDKKKYEEIEQSLRRECEARHKAEEEATLLRKSNAAAEEKAKAMEEDLKKALAEGKSISREKIVLAETKLKELTKIARAEAVARKKAEEKFKKVEKELQQYKEKKDASTSQESNCTPSLETKLQSEASKLDDDEELADLESKLALFKESFDKDTIKAELNEQNEQDDIDGAYMFGPQH